MRIYLTLTIKLESNALHIFNTDNIWFPNHNDVRFKSQSISVDTTTDLVHSEPSTGTGLRFGRAAMIYIANSNRYSLHDIVLKWEKWYIWSCVVFVLKDFSWNTALSYTFVVVYLLIQKHVLKTICCWCGLLIWKRIGTFQTYEYVIR